MTALQHHEPSLTVAALPSGTVELAAAWWRLLDEVSPVDGGHAVEPWADADGETRRAVTDELTLPLRIEPTWPPPATPTPAGDGWIHDETVDDDKAVLSGLLAANGAEGPERLAAEAQALRLPVNPYRNADTAPSVPALMAPIDIGSQGPRSASDRLVVDLTAHWAGPLATRLLAERGAEVIKVDPSCRPDGFRDRTALYQQLNGGKQIVDLDLRVAADRAKFETLLGRADLVVESFSRRVMGNLGYGPAQIAALGSRASTLALRAFPAGGPDWNRVGYGPGVHAAVGLGQPGPASPDGPARPAPIAYPDVVAGIAAAVHGLRLLHRPGRYREIALAAAIAPLIEAR